MAEGFEIVGTYKLDTSGFDAAKEEIKAGYDEIEKGAVDAQKATSGLSGATGSLTDKVAALAEEEKRAAQASEQLAKGQQDATKSATQLGSETKKTQGILSRIGSGFKQFGAGVRDGFKTAIKEAGGFSGIATQLGNKVKGLGSTVTGAFKQVGASVAGVAGQVPLIGGLATALGPVGIAATAAAAGLFKMFTNTDAGATAIQGLGKTAGVVFDRVTGLAASLFKEITSGTGIIGKGFGMLTDAVDFFINKLTPIGAIFEALSETSLFKALKDDFEFGQQIANQLDELDDKQREVNLTVAQNEIGIRKNLAALRDVTKSTEERLAIADAITKSEEESLRLKKDLLLEERRIAQQEADRQASRENGKGEVDDSIKQQITDLNIAIANAEAESVSLTERVAARRAGIVEEEERRKAAARQKAIEAQKKREAEALRLAEQRAQAEAKLQDTLDTLAEEGLARRQTESEREVEAVKKKYADLEAATLEGIAKLREASPPNAQSEITRKEAEAVLAIEKAKNDELAALERARAEEQATTREEALERIRQSLLTETEAQREAVLTQLDEQVALADQFIENEAEKIATIAELRRKAEEELTTIITDEEAKRREIELAAQQQRIALAQQNQAILTSFAEQGLQTLITAAASGENIQEQAGKQLIALLLDTLEKIIIANAFQVQAIAAGSPTPDNVATGGIAGIARGAVLAAIVRALFGVAKAAITANYEGDPYVGGDGSKPMWSGRDGYLRRLDKGERVMTRKANERYYDAAEAMEAGNLEGWIDRNYIMPAIEGLRINDDAMIARYADTDIGQRMAASITLPRMFDRGMVGAINSTRKEQQQTNDLLQALVNNTRPRRTNPRYN